LPATSRVQTPISDPSVASATAPRFPQRTARRAALHRLGPRGKRRRRDDANERLQEHDRSVVERAGRCAGRIGSPVNGNPGGHHHRLQL